MLVFLYAFSGKGKLESGKPFPTWIVHEFMACQSDCPQLCRHSLGTESPWLPDNYNRNNLDIVFIILFRNLDELNYVSAASKMARNKSQNCNLATHLPVDAQRYTYIILTVPITHRLPLSHYFHSVITL